MKFLYNLIYLLLLTIGSPYVIWRAAVQRKNRSGWKEKLLGLVPRRTGGKPCIWIHAVSVGEVNLLPKLVGQLKTRYPHASVAISSTTETGLKLAQQKFPDEHVFFCPSDFSWAINQTLDRIAPEMLVLTELELWPNLISLTADRDIPVILINGRISATSYRGYRRIRFLIRPVVKRLVAACVQTTEFRDRLVNLGMPADQITVTGNIKFDNAMPTPAAHDFRQQLEQIANFRSRDFVFVAGSTLEVEDLMLVQIFDELKSKYPRLRLVLVPRHPDRLARIEDHICRLGLKYSLRSHLDHDSSRSPSSGILIVDVIGELAQWWQMADAGFVGGSLGRRGGQNMIEPAILGVPICFGPDTVNFKEVVQLLLKSGGAQIVEDQTGLKRFVEWTIQSSTDAAAMGNRARQAMLSQQGALEKTLATLVDEYNKRTRRRGNVDSRNAA